ncbi:hypothetical protein MKW92_002808 [Papaver armeniacum]|nr:hypothetical protein MKW92_002808 [Papaver armeniacum]
MALRNVTKMLSQRLFSRGTGGIVTNTGGRTKTSQHITDEHLRGVCERVEQATEEAKQLYDECEAVFYYGCHIKLHCTYVSFAGPKRAFPKDRLIWASFIFGVGIAAVQQFQEILKTRNAIEDKKKQLSARRNVIKDKESQSSARQELRLPALSA